MKNIDSASPTNRGLWFHSQPSPEGKDGTESKCHFNEYISVSLYYSCGKVNDLFMKVVRMGRVGCGCHYPDKGNKPVPFLLKIRTVYYQLVYIGNLVLQNTMGLCFNTQILNLFDVFYKVYSRLRIR